MLENEFTQIGLNGNEREVYLTILKAGKIPHERVSRLTGINRTTVYSIARKLSKLGLISEDFGSKVSYLVSEKPEAMFELVKREEENLSLRKKAIGELVKELKMYPTAETYSVPKIKFIDDKNLENFFKKELSAWTDSGLKTDNTYWGFQDHSFTEKYQHLIDWSWENIPPDTKVRFFTNKADIEEELQKKYPERRIRVLSDRESFDSSLWVIGDYIIMANSRERPHYLVEICDARLARNQRQLFKNLWDMAQM